MKLDIQTDVDLTETEVLIRCAEVDEHIAAIVATLRMHDRRIVGRHDGASVMVPAGDILYFESIDRRTFAYTASSVLEVTFNISDLAQRLEGSAFVHAAKGCLINLCRVTSLRPYVGGRLLAMLDNGEEVVVSRKYAKDIKQHLGIERSQEGRRS